MKFWKVFLLVTIPYALLMIIFKVITADFGADDLIGVVVGSLLFGLLFTLAINFFVKWQMKRIVVELNPDEKLIKEGGANHILNLEGVGGKLVLTDKRLVFKSHKVNIQVHQQSFLLSEINTVEAAKTAGLLKNILFVHLNDSVTHKFVVFEPEEWVREIEARLAPVQNV
jgi:hypothetical protein